ncbi:MAG: DUF11 domain-containing protein [Geobacteraceae bacterium]|nr:DUF11 domain-containing protein [Geobacteraceae bacterium]
MEQKQYRPNTRDSTSTKRNSDRTITTRALNCTTRKENKEMRTERSFITRCALGAAAVALAVCLGTPQQADANTAANTSIINTATVNYRDTGGVAQNPVTAQATVTVILVASAPTLNAPADLSTTSGTAVIYNYEITATANGPDSYNLTRTIAESAGITPGTSTAVISTPSVTLGASTLAAPVTIASAGITPITVPSDGTANVTVNGIVGGDTVFIGGQAYTVASIVDNANGTSTINVNGNGAASALLQPGTLIAERQTFTVTVTPGTIIATGDQTVTVPVTATSVADGTKSASDTTITTVQVANLQVLKEVSTDGTTFSASVSRAPGQTIYYRITVTNNGAANATSVVITDPLTVYTIYTAGSAKRAAGAATTYAAAPTSLTDAADPDGYDYALTTAGTVTYNVGILTPGAGNAVQLFFQATVR